MAYLREALHQIPFKFIFGIFIFVFLLLVVLLLSKNLSGCLNRYPNYGSLTKYSRVVIPSFHYLFQPGRACAGTGISNNGSRPGTGHLKQSQPKQNKTESRLGTRKYRYRTVGKSKFWFVHKVHMATAIQSMWMAPVPVLVLLAGIEPVSFTGRITTCLSDRSLKKNVRDQRCGFDVKKLVVEPEPVSPLPGYPVRQEDQFQDEAKIASTTFPRAGGRLIALATTVVQNWWLIFVTSCEAQAKSWIQSSKTFGHPVKSYKKIVNNTQ